MVKNAKAANTHPATEVGKPTVIDYMPKPVAPDNSERLILETFFKLGSEQ